MKVLVLSVDPWCLNNSFGNTYSNILGQMDNLEIAHLYLLDGIPDYEKNVTCYFQIPESQIVKSAFSLGRIKVGRELKSNDIPTTNVPTVVKKKSVYSRLLQTGKKHHWNIMFTAREIAWKMGRVDYDGLFDFIERFNPDIFLLAYYNVYNSNRIALKIKKRFDIPMVMVMMMDHYSLKRYSWRPSFWIDRFAKRAKIRKLVGMSERMFVISKKLKEEVEEQLHVPCSILYKIPSESRLANTYISANGPLKFLFTGNIYANRWKTLMLLAEELRNTGAGKLDIYTATPISKEMSAKLNIPNVSEIHPPVSSDRVMELQNEADVLVHAEAFDKFNKSLVRCAISTKIMDYLSVGRCILAIGPSDISSIEYLVENNTALVASDSKSLAEVISKIQRTPEVLTEYAQRSLKFCADQLNAEKKRKELYDSLQWAIDNYHKNNIVLSKN